MSSAAIDGVLARLAGVRRGGHGWQARCPAHDDQQPSLSLREGSDGRVLVHCHAGCSVEQIVKGMGLTMADLYERHETHETHERPTLANATEIKHEYRDADGHLLAVKWRIEADG
ncbi:MAG: hypothetical protein ACR2M0_06030, partial [Chloroflexia bacterium]